MTEQLHFHFSLSCIGEGNGNPLQCSCLENPRDRGAWWAAVYGVAQSWTWRMRLSSSSSSIPLYICTTSSLFICWWTLRLLPCPGYCKQCCNEHWGACVLLDLVFLRHVPRSEIAGLCKIGCGSIFSFMFSIVVVPIYIPTNNVGRFKMGKFFSKCFSHYDSTFFMVFSIACGEMLTLLNYFGGWIYF